MVVIQPIKDDLVDIRYVSIVIEGKAIMEIFIVNFPVRLVFLVVSQVNMADYVMEDNYVINVIMVDCVLSFDYSYHTEINLILVSKIILDIFMVNNFSYFTTNIISVDHHVKILTEI